MIPNLKTQRLSVAKVEKMTLALIEQNDQAGMKELLDEVRHRRRYHGKEALWSTCLQTLLQGDHASIASHCLSHQEMYGWLTAAGESGRFEYMEMYCPKLCFHILKGSSGFHLMDMVEQQYTRQQKEEALFGETSIKELEVVVGKLKNNPQLWGYFDAEWIGQEGSQVRQKAIEFGWSKELYASALGKSDTTMNKVRALSHVSSYPYSVCLLQLFMRRKQHLAQGKFHRILDDMQKDANAHPMDLALATILKCKAKDYNYVLPCEFAGHPNDPQVTPEQTRYLTALVNVHLGLGSLQTLVDMLVNDKLKPMMEMHISESFDIASLV